jgi:hypothetical protein
MRRAVLFIGEFELQHADAGLLPYKLGDRQVAVLQKDHRSAIFRTLADAGHQSALRQYAPPWMANKRAGKLWVVGWTLFFSLVAGPPVMASSFVKHG